MEGNFDSSAEHTELILSGLDLSKATGPDGIPNYLLKSCSHSLSKSLSVVFKKSKQTGTFPSPWKVARIKPIFKDGAKESAVDYRPAALLTYVSRAYERCIVDQLLVVVSGKISSAQFGFRKGRSCVLQLLVSLYKIYDSRDEKISHSLYLDLREAFNKVEHGILIEKLYEIGVSGYFVRIIMNYLHNKKRDS